MELQNVFEVRRLIILIAYEVPIMCLRKATGSGYNKTWGGGGGGGVPLIWLQT